MSDLKYIEDKIYWAWQKAKAREMEKEEGWHDKLHVTDLVYECLRPAYFRLTREGEVRSAGMRSFSYMWYGTILHKTSLGDKNEVEVSGFGVYGRVDDILNIGKRVVIVDKKTHRGDPKGVAPQHEKQVKYYAVLYNETYGIKADYGAVIYVDPDSMREVVFAFELGDLSQIKEELKKKAEHVMECIKNKRAPERKRGWSCEYCLYWDKCLEVE